MQTSSLILPRQVQSAALKIARALGKTQGPKGCTVYFVGSSSNQLSLILAVNHALCGLFRPELNDIWRGAVDPLRGTSPSLPTAEQYKRDASPEDVLSLISRYGGSSIFAVLPRRDFPMLFTDLEDRGTVSDNLGKGFAVYLSGEGFKQKSSGLLPPGYSGLFLPPFIHPRHIPVLTDNFNALQKNGLVDDPHLFYGKVARTVDGIARAALDIFRGLRLIPFQDTRRSPYQ